MSRHGDNVDEICRRAGLKERRRMGNTFLTLQEAECVLAFIKALDNRESEDAQDGSTVPSS